MVVAVGSVAVVALLPVVSLTVRAVLLRVVGAAVGVVGVLGVAC